MKNLLKQMTKIRLFSEIWWRRQNNKPLPTQTSVYKVAPPQYRRLCFYLNIKYCVTFLNQITSLYRLYSTMQIYHFHQHDYQTHHHHHHHHHPPHEVLFKGNVLVFPNVTKEHRGTYYCVATNVVSSNIMLMLLMRMTLYLMIHLHALNQIRS